jgi:hypothetical protein
MKRENNRNVHFMFTIFYLQFKHMERKRMEAILVRKIDRRRLSHVKPHSAHPMFQG